MKRYLLFSLLVIIISSLLCSCVLFRDPTPWEEGKQKDTLFSSELLAEWKIEELPLPAPENVYLGGKTLYCNMTREEYESYVQSVVEYLLNDENLFHTGYNYGTSMGSFFGFPPYWIIYKYAPLIEGYDVSAESHRFIYSLSEEMEISNGMASLNGYRNISIEWCPTTPNNSEFSYTVKISLDADMEYEYNLCYHSHDMIEVGNYPVAGTEKIITLYHCTRCGCGDRSEYLTGEGKFSINIVEGAEYVLDCDEWSYDNMVVTLKTRAVTDAELKVVANGAPLPRTKTEFEYWSYVFIMPAEDVDISITIAEENEDYPYFSSLAKFEPWLDALSAENVTKLRVITEKLGAPVGSLRNNQSNLNSIVISSFLSTLKNKSLIKTSYESIENAEELRTVELIMSDGTVHSFSLYDDVYYLIDGVAYEMKTYPTLLGYAGNAYSYSFVTDETADVCDATTNEKVGEISIGGLEFIEYNYDPPDEAPRYRIETEFGVIYVYSAGIFSLKSEGKEIFYQLHVDIFTC